MSIGYRLALFPVTALLAALHGVAGAYAHLKATGSSRGDATP